MKRAKQLGFEILENKNTGGNFGGAYLKNSNAKEKRPISTKLAMHLVMRSSLAKGPKSLLKESRRIQDIINIQAQRFGVKVYRQANAGNHIHLIVLPHSRDAFKNFVRAISGLIARLILGTERGRGQTVKFWDQRPFTRFVTWGREFKTIANYLLQNTLEALGFIPYQEREYPDVRKKPPLLPARRNML